MSLISAHQPAPRRPPSRAPFMIGAALILGALLVGVVLWTRQPTPPPSPPPAPSARPTPAPAPTSETAHEPAAKRPGVAARPSPQAAPAVPAVPRLRITSDVAGASVFLDRRHVGIAPVEIDDVTPGSHRINVSAEGYEMYAENLEIGAGPSEVNVRFKEVRLDETIEVLHRHGVGSCAGRLQATLAGLAYVTENREDAFRLPFASLAPLEVDYLKKNLRVKVRGGKTYNFTSKDANADALLVFQKKVEAARARLASNR